MSTGSYKLPGGLRVEATDAVMICTGDYSSRRILHVNAAFTRLTGFSSQEMLGRDGDLLLADGPLQMESLLWLDTEADGREVHWIARLHRRDGTLFCAEAHLHVLPSEGDGPERMLLVMTDVTSRVATGASQRARQFPEARKAG